jgi:signal transduction histidine kinase
MVRFGRRRVCPLASRQAVLHRSACVQTRTVAYRRQADKSATGLSRVANARKSCPMRLAQFIIENTEELLVEWEAFALSLLPPGHKMTSLALRDHATQILMAIAQDIESNQTDLEQAYKSKGFVPIAEAARTAAMTHGALRYLAGFDLRQLAAEFRALRASVLRLWLKRGGDNGTAFYQMTRFNESIDQALAESIANYSDEVAKSRDTFLAILGHDLRSPLSAIANSGLYLGSPGLLPVGAPLDAVRRINRSAAKMGLLIKDLLEYTRTRLGRAIPISPEPMNMEQVCRSAFDEIRAVHPERIFRLETSGELDGHFDGERIQQVLSNLLNNAVQHGAFREPITLRAHGEHDRIILQVKNHGQPIPAEQLQVIFDPLVQIPAAAVSEDGDAFGGSLGLGLYIARQIVTMHGGTLAAESTDRNGTVFSARLPRNSTATASEARL